MLTIIIAAKAKRNDVNLTESQSLSKVKFVQMMVVKEPVNIPAMIPFFVVFFHFNINNKAGPNEEPRPVQA